MLRRINVTMFLAASVLLTSPGAASAHSVTGAGPTAASFLRSGFEHMLLGWDHLLFVAGVLILARDARRATTLISLFALGHSATLILATLAGWRVNASLVDVVIAVSVVFVGVVGLWGRPVNWRWFAAVVLGFGLVHGFGLATRLQDLGLPRNGLLVRVVLFNVGVEGGQLVAILTMICIGLLVRRVARGPNWQPLSQIGLVAAGLAAVWLIVVAWVDQREARAEFLASGCRVGERTELLWAAPAAEPPRRFYGPQETAPDDDFAYVLTEGYLIVQYNPHLPAGQVDRLRTFVDERARIAAGAAPGQVEAVKAVTGYGTLTCPRFDLAALGYFVDAWSKDPRSRPFQ